MWRRKRRRRKRILIVSFVLACVLFASFNYDRISNDIVDRVVSASLSDIRLPAVRIGEYDLSTVHLPDISLSSIFDAIADAKDRIVALVNDERAEISYSDILQDEESVSSKSDNTIRLSDICSDIDKEDVVDTATGLADAYFDFWFTLADEYCLGVEPALWVLEKEKAEASAIDNVAPDTETVVEQYEEYK